MNYPVELMLTFHRENTSSTSKFSKYVRFEHIFLKGNLIAEPRDGGRLIIDGSGFEGREYTIERVEERIGFSALLVFVNIYMENYPEHTAESLIKAFRKSYCGKGWKVLKSSDFCKEIH